MVNQLTSPSDAGGTGDTLAPPTSTNQQLRIIGEAASGLTIWEDPFGGTYAIVAPGGRPTLLPSGYANLVRSQISIAGDAGGAGVISPTAAAQIAEDARQFDLTLEQRGLEFDQGVANDANSLAIAQAQLDQDAQQFERSLQFNREQLNAAAQQRADEFNVSNQTDVQQFNAQLEQQAQLANQQAQIRVAETNAQLRAQEASLTEQIRQTDLQDARERENLRFMVVREGIAVEEGNQARLQSAVALREQIEGRIESNRLTRQQMTTDVQTINAQIENNVNVFNAQEKARTEALNEARRATNLSELRENAELIGELAANPADVGKLAGFLRAGGGGQISSAIARGENAITDESLAPLSGALGAQRSLLEGPTVATPNLIEGAFVDAPVFDTPLGTAPEVADLFNAINPDFSGIERGPSPQALDPSQFFQQIGLPPEIQATLLQMPPEVQAQFIEQFTGGGAAQIAPTGGAAGGAVPTVESTFQPVINPNALNTAGEPLQPREFAATVPVGETDLVIPEGTNVDNIDPTLTQDLIDEFFGRLTQMEHGGKAPPGTPVVVGDGKGDSRELAMTDARGNLVVIPFDKLPHAQDGGVFEDFFSGIESRFFDRTAGTPTEGTKLSPTFDDISLQPISGFPSDRTGGVPTEGTKLSPTFEDLDPVVSVGPAPVEGSLDRTAFGTDPTFDFSSAEPVQQPLIGSPTFLPAPIQPIDKTAPFSPFIPTTAPHGIPERNRFGFVGDRTTLGPGPILQPDEVLPASRTRVESQIEQMLANLTELSNPQPAAIQQPAPIPTAQAVAQTAQNPAVGTGQIAPVSSQDALSFLSGVQQDALRRGGFTDPTQISPIRVSAPGTSRFLQDLSASVAGTFGFGPTSLFFEELARLQPRGVGQGIARRTA